MKQEDNKIELISRICLDVLNISIDELITRNNKPNIVDRRNILIYYLKACLGYDNKQLSNLFKKDRTSISYAINTFKNRISINDTFYINKSAEIENYLGKQETNFVQLENQVILNLIKLGYQVYDIAKFLGRSQSYILSLKNNVTHENRKAIRDY